MELYVLEVEVELELLSEELVLLHEAIIALVAVGVHHLQVGSYLHLTHPEDQNLLFVDVEGTVLLVLLRDLRVFGLILEGKDHDGVTLMDAFADLLNVGTEDYIPFGPADQDHIMDELIQQDPG